MQDDAKSKKGFHSRIKYCHFRKKNNERNFFVMKTSNDFLRIIFYLDCYIVDRILAPKLLQESYPVAL